MLHRKVWKEAKSLAIIGTGSELKGFLLESTKSMLTSGRMRWTFLHCCWENTYITSTMSSWSALYQNWNKGRKRRKSQVVASLCSLSFSPLTTSQRLTFIATLLVNSCFWLNIHLQDLEEVVDQEEEEFEVKMDQAWTFLTSFAPSDLSLLKEGFQGKNSRRVNISMLLVTGSQVSDSSWNFFGYSVIHQGRLCVIGLRKNPRWCSTVQTRIFLEFADPSTEFS